MELNQYTTKRDQLEHLLNDPDVAMDPDQIWDLLAELALEPLTTEH